MHGGRSLARVGPDIGGPRWTAYVAWLVVIVAMAVSLGASTADACTCDVDDGPRLVPEDGATDVPLNAVVYCRRYECWDGRVAVLDENHAFVEGGWSFIESEHWGSRTAVFRPNQLLAPHATYEVWELIGEVDAVRAALDAGEATMEELLAVSDRLASLSTGEAIEGAAPPLPVVDAAAITPGSCLDDFGTCTNGEFHFVTSVPVHHEGALLVVDFDGSATLDAVALSGNVAAAWTNAAPLTIGSSVCGVAWPDIAAGAPLKVSVGALGPAGAFSGWTEAIELDGAPCWSPEPGAPPEPEPPADDARPPPPAECSCSGGEGLAVAGALVTGFRLRRRRTPG